MLDIPSTVNNPTLSTGEIGLVNNLVLEKRGDVNGFWCELEDWEDLLRITAVKINAVAGSITYNGTSNQIINFGTIY